MVKQNRDLGRVAVEYCRQRGLMGVLRELAARKERQRAWKKAVAHAPPVTPVVGGATVGALSTAEPLIVNFAAPDCQPAVPAVIEPAAEKMVDAGIATAERVEAAVFEAHAPAATFQAPMVEPAHDVAIVEPAAERPLAEIVPPKTGLAQNLERALATLRAQMEEAT